MLVRIGRNGISQTSPGELSGGATTLDNWPAASRKNKHSFFMWRGIRTLGHLSQINENLGSYRNLYVDVSSSFICYSKKLDATSRPSAGEETRRVRPWSGAPWPGPREGHSSIARYPRFRLYVFEKRRF